MRARTLTVRILSLDFRDHVILLLDVIIEVMTDTARAFFSHFDFYDVLMLYVVRILYYALSTSKTKQDRSLNTPNWNYYEQLRTCKLC